MLCIYEWWIVWEHKIIFAAFDAVRYYWEIFDYIYTWFQTGKQLGRCSLGYQRNLLFSLIALAFSCNVWRLSLKQKWKQLKFWFIRACRYVHNFKLESSAHQGFVNKDFNKWWLSKIRCFPNIGFREVLDSKRKVTSLVLQLKCMLAFYSSCSQQNKCTEAMFLWLCTHCFVENMKQILFPHIATRWLYGKKTWKVAIVACEYCNKC